MMRFPIFSRAALAGAALVLAVLSAVPMPGRAVEPDPDYKTLIFPSIIPKAGSNAPPANAPPGDIRNTYETYYENYWTDTSYFRYDPATGAKIRGFYIDTKTYGYIHMPWPITQINEGGTTGAGTGEPFQDGARLHSQEITVVADGADADGVWTPGESFRDDNGNGQYDETRPAEDFWNNSNTQVLLQRRDGAGNPLGAIAFPRGSYRGPVDNTAAWNATAGELYADYNDNTDLTNDTIGYDAVVGIYVAAGGAQTLVNINELDLTPTDAASVNEGDFVHTLVADPAMLVGVPPPNVPRNGVFDYTSTNVDEPQVRAATYRNGNALVVQYPSYVVTNATTEAAGYIYRFADTHQVVGPPPANSAIRTITVTVYQTGELFGVAKAPAAFPPANEYGDNPAGANNVNLWPNTRDVLSDNTWTPQRPAEPFEDYLVFGGANGRYRQDLDPAPPIRPGRNGVIAPADYAAYINWNYNGDAAALIARAGNGRYDGPEAWTERQQTKVTVAPLNGVSTPEPLPSPIGNWGGLPFGFATWQDWWEAAFNSPAPGWGGLVANVNPYAPDAGPAANAWIPAQSWSYDSDREFCDLPSSMYHLGGDPTAVTAANYDPLLGFLRTDPAAAGLPMGDSNLGEITSPWSNNVYGQDVGPAPAPGNPDWVGPGAADNLIIAAGPFCFNIHGNNGHDAGNVLALEHMTWRTAGDRVADPDYPANLRDTNLDGFLDTGLVRAGDVFYANGGDGAGAYPYNRMRYMEDLIELWDGAQDFNAFVRPSDGVTDVPLYGYGIYEETENPGSGGLGGPAGATTTFLTRDRVDPYDITFQIRPIEGGNLDDAVAGGAGITVSNVVAGANFAMGILCHEQGHDLLGWPDLYDYDVWNGQSATINTPIGAYDLMSGGGLVHGIPDFKAGLDFPADPVSGLPWITPVDLTTVVPLNGGPTIVELWPGEDYHQNSFFRYRNPNAPDEYLYFYYYGNNSPYSPSAGGPGVYVTHTDNDSNPLGVPNQQRQNGHYTWEIIQADGLYQLQDGTNSGDDGDPFPGTANKRIFTEDTIPALRWWDQQEAGLRVLDIQLPAGPGQPALVTFERYQNPTSNVPYYGNDLDLDAIPDPWEVHYWGVTGTANATSDSDNDGLSDLYEFMARTDPTKADSNLNGTTDEDEDTDSDGLLNAQEQLLGSHPRLADTDDDGVSDGLEASQFTSPISSLSPLVDRVLNLTGAPGDYARIPARLVPWQYDYTLSSTNWTVEAWVKPAAISAAGDIIAHQVAAGDYQYRLAIQADGRIALSFSPDNGGADIVLATPQPLVAGTWAHVSGSWSRPQGAVPGRLTIRVDGNVVAQMDSSGLPLRTSGAGEFVRIGQGFNGQIDEARFWNQIPASRTLAELRLPLAGTETGLVGYFRFDDGTFAGSTSASTDAWTTGQIENFTKTKDWLTTSASAGWANAATRMGTATLALSADSPINSSGVDTDGDGIPDGWEIANGLDPNNPDDTAADADGDGLTNGQEYLAGTNPNLVDTDLDSLADGNEDSDSDGLTNAEEQDQHGTNPGLADTDDDGFSDGMEIDTTVLKGDRYVTSPLYSRSPYICRNLVLNGTAIPVPSGEILTGADRFSSTFADAFTLEAWVKPAGAAETGTIIGRTLVAGGKSFELRLDGNIPSVQFIAASGALVKAGGTVALPAGEWTHLAGVWDNASNSLQLYVNGLSYRALMSQVEPKEGTGQTFIGNGIRGLLDEVRVWKNARTAKQIIENRDSILNSPWDPKTEIISLQGLVAYYRFDDGGLTSEDSVHPLDGRDENMKLDSGVFDQLERSYVLVGTTVSSGDCPFICGEDDVEDDKIADWWQRMFFSLYETKAASSSTNLFPITASAIPENWRNSPAAPIGQDGDTTVLQAGSKDSAYVLKDVYLDFPAGTLNPLWGSPTNRAINAFTFSMGVTDRQNDVIDYNVYLNGDLIFSHSNDVSVAENDDRNDELWENNGWGVGLFGSSNAFELRFFVIDASLPLKWGRNRISIEVVNRNSSAQNAPVGFDVELKDVEVRADYENPVLTRTATLPIVLSKRSSWALYGGNGELIRLTQLGQANPGVPPIDAYARPWSDEFYGVAPSDLNNSGNGDEDKWNPEDDPDSDGLQNYHEFVGDLNPLSRDTDNDGVLDGSEDRDGDTLSNVGEQQAGTHPLLMDTDDDGRSDAAEVGALTGGSSSLVPLVSRVLDLDGTAGTLMELPRNPKYILSDFSIEAWVKVDSLGSPMEIFSRYVESGVCNYRLGVLADGKIELRFTREDRSSDVVLVSPQALVPGIWFHVAGMVGPLQGGRRMQIHLDGVVVADSLTNSLPVTNGVGPEQIRAGVGLNGMLDELRIYATPQAVRTLAERHSATPPSGHVAHFRFDDGTYPGATSGRVGWLYGQVEDFTSNQDWLNCWKFAGTLKGTAAMVAAPPDAPVDVYGDDTDGDGMPDGWETANGLNPAMDDASGDGDGDGMDNLGEFHSGTHPFIVDTNLDGIPDGIADADGDGLSNIAEAMTYFTRPDCPDTDDDGLSDKLEVDQDTNPLDAASPYVMRFIRNDGSGYISVPGDDPIDTEVSGSRFNLTNFTMEATVRLEELPSVTGNPVVLIQRRVLPSGYVNYEMGIGVDDLPYVRFQTDNGTEYKAVGYAPPPVGEWFHIGGRYGVDERNQNNHQLGLFYNQVKVTRDVTNAKPVTGLQLGDLLLAQGLHGDLDEVRIWRKDKSEDFIDNLTGKSLLFGLDSALAGSLSPNGGQLDGPTVAVPTWTVSAWVRTDSEGGVIVQKPSGVADDGQVFYNFRIILENGIPTASYDFQAPVQPPGAACVCRWGQVRLNGDLPINDGQWHYIAFTFDGTVSRLIVDDRQVATLPHVPAVGGVDWHMLPTEPDPISYCLGCPIRLADIAGQPLTIGTGFAGLIDEVQVWDNAIPTATLIGGREGKPQVGLPGLPNLVRYFDFDNDENTRDNVVEEKISLASGLLIGNAIVDLTNSDSNAPLTVTALEILGTDLALYMPFDDGRSTFPGGCRTDGYQAVEDMAFGRRYDFRFAGTLSNVANIDFSPLANPYGYSNPMAYPGLFPLAVDSAFRVDSDGDGMPDIYEQYFWLDPNLVTSQKRPNIGPFEDLDFDGLNNLYEYYAGTDPTFADSNGNGIIDSEEDGDRDGLSNLDEQKLGTHPGRVDTDDDGFTDLQEGKVNISGHVFAANPADSADYKDPVNLDNPDCRFRFKSMVLNGSQYRVPAPADDRRRFNSASWTIEASVRPTNANASGPLMRYEGAYTPVSGGASAPIKYWELGLLNGAPYVTMDANTTYTLAPVGMSPLVLNEWTHLAGVFDPENDLLALYVNGTLAAQLQIVENAMSGSETAFRFPGKVWIGGAGVLGNLDEVRFWTLPRTMEQIRTGMRKLVQSNESGLEFYFRFDDGRRSTAPGTEVPDGLTANDGQGAEDYAADHRLLANNLEIPWLYSLRDVVFACDQAVLCTRMDFDDLDRDTLPDGWENLSMIKEFTTYSPIIGGAGQIVGAASFLTRIVGSEEPSFSAGLKGWRPAFTPVYSLPGIQLTETPDAAWLFKDVYIDPADLGQIEMRIGVTSPFEIYFNSTGNTNQLLNVARDTSAVPAGETFLTLGDTAPVSPLYMSPENSAKYLRSGRNRIAIRLDNTNGGALYEYFNFEMRAGGDRYLIRRGDDNAASDNKGLSRWWIYAKKGSTVEPPMDGLGRIWSNVSYSLDNDNDFEPDGLNTKYESLVRTNPFARDTDADAVLDTGEDFDQDQLSNLNEYQIGSDPRLVDTDDDGYPDFTEDRMATSAASSLNPAIGRTLSVPGTSTDYMKLPDGPAYALDTYTLDAWVFPKAISAASVVRRTVQAGIHNYSLELDAAGRVVTRFTPWNGSADVLLTSPAAIPVNQWTHLSTAFNGENGLFTLYVNGALVASSTVQAGKRPATNGTGPHLGLVGQGFNGLIDEVRIWSTFEADRALAAQQAFPSLATLTAADMVLFMRKPLAGNETGLTAYFRMDDSTNPHGVSGENSWTHGQVENFSSLYPNDWGTGWCNAATLRGAAKITSGGNTLIPGGDCLFLTDPFAVANNPVQYLDYLKSPFTKGAWNISKVTPPNKTDPDGTPYHLLTDTNAYWFCQSTVSRSGTSAMMAGGVKGRPNDHIVNTAQTFNGITNYDLKNFRLKDNQSSWMQTTVVGPGSVSFYWKASCEVPVSTINNNEADFLSFHVNDALKAYTSDTTNNWVKVSINLPAGLQTLRWTYAKDNFGTQGSDAGWVDDVAFLHTGPDTDGDGLPDAYEVLPAYGSNPLLADTDGDGISDADEARLGTSLSAANVTLLGTLSVVDGVVCVDWAGMTGMKYQVQISYDGMTTWQNAPTALSENQNSYRVATANSPLRYCDPLSPTYPAAATYRIVTIP